MTRIDDWRRCQSDLPSRAEAIQRLVEQGLTVPLSFAEQIRRKQAVPEIPDPTRDPNKEGMATLLRDLGLRNTTTDEPEASAD